MAASISKDDFRRIRLSLALAVVMILAGAAAVFASMQSLQAEQKAHQAAELKRKDIQGRLARARDEEQEIKQKIARFNDLATRGVIGEEQRLEWVETIRRIKTARKLFDIQYEFAPQRPLDGTPNPTGGFEFVASSMRLNMQLLHEEDILNFLADLRTSVNAHLRVSKCEMERLPKGQANERGGVAPQLRAQCEIDWITIRERKAA